MFITKELLIEKGACEEGLEWFEENFPSGCELNDETIAKISNCQTDFIWWFYKNIQQDKRLYKLCGVNRSHGVNCSDGVDRSFGVNCSDGVNHSYGVNRSNGVNHSHGVNRSYGVNRSLGVNCSFGVFNSFGVDNAMFLANKPREYSIFGINISKERYDEIHEEVNDLLDGWRPTFTNAQKIYLASESNWRNVKAESIVEISKEEAWASMPQKAIDYVKSLKEFNADMFFEITGIR